MTEYIYKLCKKCNNSKRYKSTGHCCYCRKISMIKFLQTTNGKKSRDQSKIKYNTANPWTKRLSVIKKRCSKKNIPFEITVEDIKNIWPKDNLCPVLGIKLQHGYGAKKGSFNLATIDRVIPKLGYVPGNIIVISHQANSIKSNETNPANIRRVAEWLERELKKRQG